MAFNRIDRAASPEYQDFVWLHDSAPVWIVPYEDHETGAVKFYEAYRCIARVPRGRMPWSVNNKRLSNGDGFRTLQAAMDAAVLSVPVAFQDNATAK